MEEAIGLIRGQKVKRKKKEEANEAVGPALAMETLQRPSVEGREGRPWRVGCYSGCYSGMGVCRWAAERATCRYDERGVEECTLQTVAAVNWLKSFFFFSFINTLELYSWFFL